MDIINHSVTGVVIHTFIALLINCFVNIGFITLAIIGGTGLIGGIPDIGGWYMAKYKHDNYKWRNRAHSGDINKVMKWIPAWGTHTVLFDSWLHDEGKRWYVNTDYNNLFSFKYVIDYLLPWRWRERMYVEVVTWILLLILIYVLKIILINIYSNG